MADIFLDTSYAIALAIESDKHNSRARELAEVYEKQQTRFVTTVG